MAFSEKPCAVILGGHVADPTTTSASYGKLKSSIRKMLLDKFYLSALVSLTTAKMRAEIAAMVEQVANEEQTLDDTERHTLCREIQNEMLGPAPLDLVLADPTVLGILVNRFGQVYVTRHGKPELVTSRFVDAAYITRMIDNMASMLGGESNVQGESINHPDACGAKAVICPACLESHTESYLTKALLPGLATGVES